MFSFSTVRRVLSLVIFIAPTLARLQDFGIPPSDATVDVKAFNVANFMLNNLTSVFLSPVLPGREDFTLPLQAFLIEHKPTKKKFMFDLAMRNDPQNLPPAFSSFFSSKAITFDPFKDITELLQDGGVSLYSIEAVFWRSAQSNVAFSSTQTPCTVTPILTTSVSGLCGLVLNPTDRIY
jgi:hypothetical protein